MGDLLLQSAVSLRALIESRAISAEELALEHIRRIEAFNPQLNAIVDFDPDRVLAQARALDSSPPPPGLQRRLLHGLPLTVKASISVAGHRCETGSLLNRGHRPTEGR